MHSFMLKRIDDASTLRVLKNRYTGETGICTYLHYDKDTGRLSEGKFNVEDET